MPAKRGSKKSTAKKAAATKKKATAKKPVATKKKATAKRKAAAREATTARATKAQQLPSQPPDRPSSLGPIAEQLGPHLRLELEEVAKSEAKILKGLANQDVRAQFIVDPAGALERMGVEVPPIMKKRLKTRPPSADDLRSRRSFRLPDGQVVTATVNVRFTGTERR